ncbi:hypothetical protein RRG08_003528 [Elysia crispata]|uniref:Uncharacterized protein n=1 Tax=Elysia crispata TaxID=231223 RepID=A0AAE1CTB2_9GAST|nr:hypothetical protein RRG08_003528 [Elysia crispata]
MVEKRTSPSGQTKPLSKYSISFLWSLWEDRPGQQWSASLTDRGPVGLFTRDLSLAVWSVLVIARWPVMCQWALNLDGDL